jgi:transcription elongation factor GreA
MKRLLTKEGLEKLVKELENLEKVKRREVSEKIRHAASYGDLKENASYTEAKEEQGFIEGRIRELKGVISQAEIIEKKAGDLVQVGSHVSLTSKDGKDQFQIVGSEESDVLEGKISFKSSLGLVLLNKKKGDTVKIQTPSGEKEYKIIEVK